MKVTIYVGDLYRGDLCERCWEKIAARDAVVAISYTRDTSIYHRPCAEELLGRSIDITVPEPVAQPTE